MPTAVEEIAPGYMRVSRSEAERRGRWDRMAQRVKEILLDPQFREWLGPEKDLIETQQFLAVMELMERYLAATQPPETGSERTGSTDGASESP
jgi:hypothetical protein